MKTFKQIHSELLDNNLLELFLEQLDYDMVVDFKTTKDFSKFLEYSEDVQVWIKELYEEFIKDEKPEVEVEPRYVPIIEADKVRYRLHSYIKDLDCEIEVLQQIEGFDHYTDFIIGNIQKQICRIGEISDSLWDDDMRFIEEDKIK